MCSEFLAELYSEAGDLDGRAAIIERAHAAAKASRDVRLLRSMFVPDDEMCFLVFEAESPDAVARLAKLAALPIDRIVRTELGRGDGSAEGTNRREAL